MSDPTAVAVGSRPPARDPSARFLRAGIETLDFGFATFDRALRLVVANRAFRTLRGYPAALCKPGTELIELYRFNARRGDYGAGDSELLALARLDRIRDRRPHDLELELASGQVLAVRYAPLVNEGLLLTYADVTARKRAEQDATRRGAELHVALDNMPGALVFTDDAMRIVFCNPRFAQMYGVPAELLERERSYVDVFRYLAEHGYYGEGDVEAMVAKRVASLRNPTGVSFEDFPPNGRVYRVVRSKAAAGGTVTVITDITEQRAAEQELARREAEFHVALDNMPGALVFTDPTIEFVLCSGRFAEMYGLPPDLLQRGRSYVDVLRFLAEQGSYGDGDLGELVDRRVRSLRDPTGISFEDRLPNGRVYKVGRQRVDAGGTVTVISEITELKEAEDRLRDAMRQVEAANLRVTEQNTKLEALSAKLAKYLSPQLYRSIFLGEKGADVASQRKKLTVFFSDIAGFTETTDILESEELTTLLNQYLREMSSIALEHGATIDKFIGDAIMLFFGDPETRGPREDAVACVRMAIAMQQRMRDLQAEWRERGQQHVFQLRIGINTGFCTVGNFGSDERVDYTIIGGEVNLASRLQTHADLGGILLAHETYSLVKDEIVAEETGTITVKGFPRPVRTYRVVGVRDDAASEGRVIRQERDGLLLIVDRKKLGAEGREAAIRALEDALLRLKS